MRSPKRLFGAKRNHGVLLCCALRGDKSGDKGMVPARKVVVKDTTGAGDAFCAGAMSGLTYGKSLAESVKIGTVLASSVITSLDNVCPRFRPEEFGLESL